MRNKLSPTATGFMVLPQSSGNQKLKRRIGVGGGGGQRAVPPNEVSFSTITDPAHMVWSQVILRHQITRRKLGF